MKSKKGFTLIELIAVIVILAIILVIGTLSIQRFITKGRNKSFDVLVNSFQDSAKTAYTECILKPKSDFCKTHPVPGYNESVTVTLGELIDAEFSDVLKNPWKTSEECDRNSTVTLTRKQDSQIVFDYETCLICGDKKSCDTNNGNGNGENGGSVPNNNEDDIPPISPSTNILREMILLDNPTRYTNPNLTKTSSICVYNSSTSSFDCEEVDSSGLYSKSVINGFGGGSGKTYYFRGNVTNNNVKFAGKNWKVVRINEDGTIRLILTNAMDSRYYSYSSTYRSYLDMYYTNSNVKGKLEAWYNSNIGNNENYVSRVATGNYFCEAAKVALGNYNIKEHVTSMVENGDYTPDLECATDENGYGLVNSPIGLLTYDELMFAGSHWSSEYNRSFIAYYLMDGSFKWWTMSPGGISALASVWSVLAGYPEHYYAGSNLQKLRPVINLKADVTATRDSNGYYVVD